MINICLVKEGGSLVGHIVRGDFYESQYQKLMAKFDIETPIDDLVAVLINAVKDSQERNFIFSENLYDFLVSRGQLQNVVNGLLDQSVTFNHTRLHKDKMKLIEIELAKRYTNAISTYSSGKMPSSESTNNSGKLSSLNIFDGDELSIEALVIHVLDSQEKLYFSFSEQNKEKSESLRNTLQEMGLQQKAEIITDIQNINRSNSNILYIHADGLSSDDIIKKIGSTSQAVYIAFSDRYEQKSKDLQVKLLRSGLVERVKVIESSASAFITAAHNTSIDNIDIFISKQDLETFQENFRPDLSGQRFNLEMLFNNPERYISIMDKISNVFCVDRKNISVNEKHITITFDASSTFIFDILALYSVNRKVQDNKIYIDIKDADKFFSEKGLGYIIPEICKFARHHGINPYKLYVNAGREDFETWLIQNFDENIAKSFQCNISLDWFSKEDPACTSVETRQTYSRSQSNLIWQTSKTDPNTRTVWTKPLIINYNIMFVLRSLQEYYADGEDKTVETNKNFATYIISKIDIDFLNDKSVVMGALKDEFVAYINKHQPSVAAVQSADHAADAVLPPVPPAPAAGFSRGGGRFGAGR
jgi:L-rhamnose mutarotase